MVGSGCGGLCARFRTSGFISAGGEGSKLWRLVEHGISVIPWFWERLYWGLSFFYVGGK
jgi:hypothetical protein